MDKYQALKNLGDGTYGSVVKAVDRTTGELVAIKKMKKQYTDWKECQSLEEVTSLCTLGHPNIVRLREVIKEHDMLHFVFEHMEENLYQMMCKREKQFPEHTIRNILFVVSGVVLSLIFFSLFPSKRSLFHPYYDCLITLFVFL